MKKIIHDAETDALIVTNTTPAVHPWETPREWTYPIRNWRTMDLQHVPNDAICRAKAGYKVWKRNNPDDEASPEIEELRMRQLTAIAMLETDYPFSHYEFVGITSPIM